MDPTVPHGHADQDGVRRDTLLDLRSVIAGQPALVGDPGARSHSEGPAADGRGESDVVQGDMPWTTLVGGPAVLWRLFFDAGAEVLDIAELIAQRCRAKGVTLELRGVDEYSGREELLDVRGVVCVLGSPPAQARRSGNTSLFRQIVQDFRAVRPVTAADGFFPGSLRWHRVGVLQVVYTDQAMDDPDARVIIEEACAGHSYTPGVPFAGDVFEVFENGKAQQVKENDQVAAAQVVVWNGLRRWGIDTSDQARDIRREIEHEIDTLDNPAKTAMYRPIAGIPHNQLWLVLNDPEARPPADTNLSDEENRKAETRFVANSARALRDLIMRLETTYEWFTEPEQFKRRGAQRHFKRLYEALRAVTRNS